MTGFRFLIPAALALLAALPARAATKYLNQLPANGTIAGSDTLPLCQNGAAGCGASNSLNQATVAALQSYFATIFAPLALTPANLPPTPPHYIAGNYTLAASDLGDPVCLGSGITAAATLTLPAAGSAGFAAGLVYPVCNISSANFTIASSSTIHGLPVNPLPPNTWAILWSDGSDWLALETGTGAAPAASGSVLGVGP